MLRGVGSDGTRAIQAIEFLRRLRGHRPWVLMTEGARLASVVTFIPSTALTLAECKSWMISQQRKGLGVVVLVGEIEKPIFRYPTERDIISGSLIAFGFPKAPADGWPPSFAPTGVIDTTRGFGCFYAFPQPMPKTTLDTIAASLAGRLAAVGLVPARSWFMPVPGLNRPNGMPTRVIQYDPARIFPPDALARVGAAEGKRAHRAHEVEAEAINWTWKNMLANGLNLLAGRGAAGKTTMALSFVATVTQGRRWPDGTQADQGSALVVEGEDPMKQVTLPRLMAAGADLRRVGLLDRPAEIISPAMLDDAARDLDKLRLVILSPIRRLIRDNNSPEDYVRRQLEPITDWALDRGVAVIGILHPRKNDDRENSDAFAGSAGYVNLTRVNHLASVDKADPEPDDRKKRRKITLIKSNIAPEGTTFFYRIEGAVVGGIETSRVVWLDETAEDAPGQPKAIGRENVIELRFPGIGAQSSGIERDFRPDCASWLRVQLSGGPLAASEILAAAKAAGFSRATVYRAASTLGVKKGTGGDAVAMWRL